MSTQTYIGTLVVITCGGCGVTFGMDQPVYNDRQRDGGSFYCTSGCGRHFTVTETQRLRKRAEKAEADSAYFRDRMREEQQEAQHARNQARGEKAAKTRLKNRITNGVCPCCQRHFVNVERHIKSQHPEFSEGA